MDKQVNKYSVLQCTGCGFTQEFEMPQYASRKHFYCPDCRKAHQSRKEECCIYCSYGSVPCPQQQVRLSQLHHAGETINANFLNNAADLL
jgi:hypothetical protein